MQGAHVLVAVIQDVLSNPNSTQVALASIHVGIRVHEDKREIRKRGFRTYMHRGKQVFVGSQSLRRSLISFFFTATGLERVHSAEGCDHQLSHIGLLFPTI